MRCARDSRPPGYALVWVILAVAIVAALVATAMPTLVILDERSKAVRTAAQLKSISLGAILFGSLVGNYPGHVSQLTSAITTSDENTCERPMSAANVATWPTNAPYVTFYLPATGLWTDLGRIRDSIPHRAFPPVKTPLFAEIPGVSAAEAAMLDLVVDNGAGDTVTYAAPVNDTTTIVYRLISSALVINNRC